MISRADIAAGRKHQHKRKTDLPLASPSTSTKSSWGIQQLRTFFLQQLRTCCLLWFVTTLAFASAFGWAYTRSDDTIDTESLPPFEACFGSNHMLADATRWGNPLTYTNLSFVDYNATEDSTMYPCSAISTNPCCFAQNTVLKTWAVEYQGRYFIYFEKFGRYLAAVPAFQAGTTLVSTCLGSYDMASIVGYPNTDIDSDTRVFFTNTVMDPDGDSEIVWFPSNTNFGCVLQPLV